MIVIVKGNPLSNIKDAWNVETVFKNVIKYQIEDLLTSKLAVNVGNVKK